MSFEVPILLCVFNRPTLTARVFESIRAVRPGRLLIVADGPRIGRTDDPDLVSETRKIISRIDWNCELETCFSEENLGCRLRMSSGLDWAFSRAERLIVLEDDCLPNPCFFGFCRELLDRFAEDDRIGMISGNHFQPEPVTSYSYYFSRWAHIWGWASWKRAWRHFDLEISQWPQCRDSGWLRSVVDSREEVTYWTPILDQVHAGTIDTWDFSWMFSCWLQKKLTILPRNNLVSNIGFGPDATHTTDCQSKLAGLAAGELDWNRHPSEIVRNQAADEYTFRNFFASQSEKVTERSRRRSWLRRFRLFRSSA